MQKNKSVSKINKVKLVSLICKNIVACGNVRSIIRVVRVFVPSVWALTSHKWLNEMGAHYKLSYISLHVKSWFLFLNCCLFCPLFVHVSRRLILFVIAPLNRCLFEPFVVVCIVPVLLVQAPQSTMFSNSIRQHRGMNNSLHMSKKLSKMLPSALEIQTIIVKIVGHNTNLLLSRAL